MLWGKTYFIEMYTHSFLPDLSIATVKSTPEWKHSDPAGDVKKLYTEF